MDYRASSQVSLSSVDIQGRIFESLSGFEFQVSSFELEAHGSGLDPDFATNWTESGIRSDSRGLTDYCRTWSEAVSPTGPGARNPTLDILHTIAGIRSPEPEARPRPQAAFTLIELMLAVGLSILLVLVAFMTFRAATRTMQDLERMAAENRLVRAGYLAALDDADHWRSQADPSYPYLRRHQSEDWVEPDSQFDVRPFKKVVWPRDPAATGNPNWSQSHDPRSWYRGAWLPNVTSGCTMLDEIYHGQKMGFTWVPDFTEEMNLQGFKDIYRSTNPNGTPSIQMQSVEIGIGHITYPRGWNPWHVMGDYARLSHIDMDTSSIAEIIPADNSHVRDSAKADKAAGSAPKQLWHVFQELGARGCATYLPPGRPTLIVAPSDNEVLASYAGDSATRCDLHFRKGEIPWSLNADANLVFRRTMAVLDGARPTFDTWSLPATFRSSLQFPTRDRTQVNRQNYAWAKPSLFNANKSYYVSGPFMPILDDFTLYTGWAHYQWIDPYGSDATHPKTSQYSSAQSWQRGLGALWFPSNPMQQGINDADLNWIVFHRETADPFDLYDVGNPTWRSKGWDKRVYDPVSGEKIIDRMMHDEGHKDLILARHQHGTWLQPRTQTDASDPDLDGSGLRSLLQVTNRRYIQHGYDKCEARIRVQDPEGKQVIEFTINPITSSYRGARQYWGRASTGGLDDGLGNTLELGDFYE